VRLRIRWDRVGRVGLLIVLAVVVGLYVQHALSYFAIRAQADEKLAAVQRMTKVNLALERERQSLTQRSTIAAGARSLGMVMVGEQAYMITGLPSAH